MPRRLFGTNGIRGIVNTEIDCELVLKVAASAGTLFGSGTVLLASDARTTGQAFKEAAASGLMASGCDVLDLGLLPTPALQFLTRGLRAKGAIMITASHNPPQYNGVKVIDSDGIELDRGKEERVEEMVFNEGWTRPQWDRVGSQKVQVNAIDAYLDGLRRHVDVGAIARRKLTVVVDPANSVGVLATPRILEDCGCRVICINGYLDGNFPGRLPEPTPSALTDLSAAVKAYGADFGVAHDGDADRAIFVDEEGTAHWGDRTFCLIADDYLSQHPGETVVTPVSSTKAIQEIASRHGGSVAWTEVGSVVVSRRIKELNSPLGGEENGGIFYAPHQPVRDGAMASALIANILAKTGKGLSRLLKGLPHYYMAKDKVAAPEAISQPDLEGLVDDSVEKVERIDGLKLWLKDGGWALIRRSGTEPIYRIFVESSSPEMSERLLHKYKAGLSKILTRR